MRAVLVTGASTGIGRACALHCAQRGWRVFAGVRSVADGAALSAQAAAITPLLLDVTVAEQVAAAAQTLAASVGGGLHGLVNNAGIAVAGPLEFLPLAQFRRQLEVNVVGQLAVTQAVLPLLRSARGRIINISSVSGRVAAPLLGAYAASKFALEALSDALRSELRPWGMHVCSVQPGPIDTPIWGKSRSAAAALQAGLPPQADSLYGAAMKAAALQVAALQPVMLPPEQVARAVWHALTARWPRARYPIGMPGYSAEFVARFAPDRLRNWLVQV